MTKYESISTQIVRIIDELEQVKVQLLKDVTMLDRLYEKNHEYFMV